MKRIKAIKQKLAAALIVALIGTSISVPGLAAPKTIIPDLELDKSSVTMYIGEEETLTVSFKDIASSSIASSATAGQIATEGELKNVVWGESSGLVEFDKTVGETVNITAVKRGKSTITATYGDKKVSCSLEVKQAGLELSLSRGKIAYDEETTLTIKTDVEDEEVGADIRIIDENGIDKTHSNELYISIPISDEGGIATYTVHAENGHSGTYTLKASATVKGKELEAEKKLTVEEPTLRLKAEEGVNLKKLDAKDTKPFKVFVDTNCADFDDFKWSIEEGDSIEMASPSDASEDTVTVTPVKEGTTIIKVVATAQYTSGMVGESVVSKEARLTLNVKDSRAFSYTLDDEADEAQGYITLDLNEAVEDGRSASFTVNDDYGAGFWAYVEDPEREELFNIEKVGNKVFIETEEKEPGTTKILVESQSGLVAAPLEVTVNTINSTLPVTIIDSEVRVSIDSEAIKKPVLNTEGLTEEQIQMAEEQLEEIMNTLMESISAAIEQSLPAFDSEEAKAILSDLVSKFGGVKPGESAQVYPAPTLNNVVMESVVTIDAEGNPVVTVVIKELVFDINLMLQKLDADGNPLGEEEDLGKRMGKNNSSEITFPLPIPSTGIDEPVAKINHEGEISYSYIQEGENGRYVNITTTHFSNFALTFVNEIPNTDTTTGGGRRGGGGGSSISSGQWIQNSVGWWYKNADGTWPANTWKNLLWNGSMQWYRFNEAGYMVTGWFTDVDGNKYFLHNVSDGRQGMMYTGWNQIEGRWYYFRENVGGPLGSLVVNTTTADGYVVDGNGVAAGYPRS